MLSRLHRGLVVMLAGALSLGVGAAPPPPQPGTAPSQPPVVAALAPVAPAPATVPPAPPPPPPPPPPSWVPQRWLPGHLLVVYYGNPLSPQMGILGQRDDSWALERLRKQAEAYRSLTELPVQPAFDLIAVVAQGSPQADRTYRLRMGGALLQREVDFTGSHHLPLFLDVQVGHSSVQAEVRALEPYLRQPWVHLALDPEFDLPRDVPPGRRIGSMRAADINWAIDYLAALAERENLPDKLLIVHQFTDGMVPGWRDIRTRSRVQLVVDMDGFGGQPTKEYDYGLFVQKQPIPGRFGGIKLFYTQDRPVFAPSQVMRLEPAPSLVMYQ